MQNGILTPGASSGLIIEGCATAAAENGVPACAVKDTICRTAHRFQLHESIHNPQAHVKRLRNPYLAAPTEAQQRPFLDPRFPLPNHLDHGMNVPHRLGDTSRPAEEGVPPLDLLRRVAGKQVVGCDVAVQEIRHEHAIGPGGIGQGEDVGALLGLRAEAEDIVDEQDGRCGCIGPGDIYIRGGGATRVCSQSFIHSSIRSLSLSLKDQKNSFQTSNSRTERKKLLHGERDLRTCFHGVDLHTCPFLRVFSRLDLGNGAARLE